MGWVILGLVITYIVIGIANSPERYARMEERGGLDDEFHVFMALLQIPVWPLYWSTSWGVQLMKFAAKRERLPRKERRAKKLAAAKSAQRYEIGQIEDRIRAARTEIRMAERQRMRDWDRQFETLKGGPPPSAKRKWEVD